MSPLPGLLGHDHVGFTVPSISQAHEFLVNVIGCDHIYSLPGTYGDSDWYARHLNVPENVAIKEIRFYRCGVGSSFEVFEYIGGNGKSGNPRNSDVGGHHVALYVEDLDAAILSLKEHGLEVFGDATASSGPSAGQRWVYFLSPWGMQFELVSYPNGKAYAEYAKTLLWDPRKDSE